MEPTQDEKCTIPVSTVAQLMKQMFKQKDTKLSKAGADAAACLINIFTEEALLRAIAKAREERGADGDLFLEVGDLEKIVGQMVVDFC